MFSKTLPAATGGEEQLAPAYPVQIHLYLNDSSRLVWMSLTDLPHCTHELTNGTAPYLANTQAARAESSSQETAGWLCRSRVQAVVRSIDVMPTILHELSISAHAKEMQGTHLQPLWESSETPTSRLAFSEALAESFEMKSVRTARHKYILSIASEDVSKRGRHFVPERPLRRELFDLLEDTTSSLTVWI